MGGRVAHCVASLRVVVLPGVLALSLVGPRLPAPAAGAQEPGEDEPPEAQALAERLVREGSPAAKMVAIQEARVLRLQMRMVRIVDRTTGVAGFRRRIDEPERSLDERLRHLNAEVTGTEVIVRLPGSILFDFDSADIRPDAERTLVELIGVIRGFPGRRVRIEGHTDSVASGEYNLRLSEQRAESVRIWLVEHSIDSGRLRVVGHGESRPVAENGTAAGRQQNRRVEVIIEKAG